MTTWQDFFKVNGEYSIRNLTVFVGVAVGSAVVLYMAWQDTLGWEIFTAYVASTGGVYGVGKWQDERTGRSAIDATVEQAPTTTTINQPDAVNLGPTDKVTVTPRKGKK